MDSPAILAKGLPGNLDEEYLAGMSTTALDIDLETSF